MPNTVRTELVARDNASQVFDRLNRSIRSNVLQANLLSSAITAGVGAATNAVGGLVNAFQSAADIQASNIAVAGDFMRLAGQSFAEATEFVDEFSIKMSNVAAGLPGATQDYVNMGKSIMDNLVPAFKELDGTINEGEFTQALEAITRDATFRAVNAGVDVNLASLGISKFLGGSSLSELSRLKFFESNPAVLAFIEEEAKKLGRDLEDLTKRERTEVLRRALAVPDEVVQASTESVSGVVEGVRSTLLDPQTGLFGLKRDLNPELEGRQSVLVAVNDLLKYTLGPTGPFARISETLKLMGVNIDPMVGLYNFINWLNDLIYEINLFVYQNQDTLTEIIGFFQDIPKRFRQLYSQLVNETTFIEEDGDTTTKVTIRTGQLYGIAGRALAESINEALASGTFVEALSGLTEGIAINLAYYINVLSKNILSFLNNLDWGLVLKSLLGIVGAVVKGIDTFIRSLDLETYLVIAGGAALVLLGGALLAGIGALVAPIVASFSAVGLAGAALIAGLYGVVTRLGAKSVDNLDWLGALLGKIFQRLRARAIGKLLGLQTRVEFFFRDLQRRILAIFRESYTFGTQIGEAIFDLFSNIADRIRRFIPGPLRDWFGGSTRNLRPAFSGFVPEGLLQEMRNKPSGSDLLVANSSELILNREQQRALFSRQPAHISFGDVVIHAGDSRNPRQLASMVIREIERQLQQAQFQTA